MIEAERLIFTCAFWSTVGWAISCIGMLSTIGLNIGSVAAGLFPLGMWFAYLVVRIVRSLP